MNAHLNDRTGTPGFFLPVSAFVVFLASYATLLNADYTTDKETFAKWDKQKLLEKTGMVTDSSAEMLKRPRLYAGDDSFIIAETPPIIDFAPVRNLTPYFFTKGNPGLWTIWGIGTVGPDECFYFAVGSHQTRDGNIFVVKYDPEKKEQSIVIDIARKLGWRTGDFIDGKIHGELKIAPDGLLPAATYFSVPPENDADWKQYRGGTLFTYNIFTGDFSNLGVPFVGDSYPYFSFDTRRGIFIGATNSYYFLACDIRAEKTLYAGKPPDGMQWESCNALLDADTGLWYATDSSTKRSANPSHLMEYDPTYNRFRRLSCQIPSNPVTGENEIMRAYTPCRMPDGAFYCMDYRGTFFIFRPEKETTELIGLNWGPRGAYVTCIAANPGSKYLYYVISGHGRGFEWGAPVIQYDTATRTKKVLAFLHPYYHEKYGFVNGGSYCFALSHDGSKLFIVFNGAFDEVRDLDTFGNPCITVVRIPESERRE